MQICQSLGSFYLLETNSTPIAYSDFFWGIWTILHGKNPWYEAICEAILVVIVAGGTSQNWIATGVIYNQGDISRKRCEKKWKNWKIMMKIRLLNSQMRGIITSF